MSYEYIRRYYEVPAETGREVEYKGEETTMALAKEDNPRWVNDLAVAHTIRALKAEIERLKEKTT